MIWDVVRLVEAHGMGCPELTRAAAQSADYSIDVYIRDKDGLPMWKIQTIGPVWSGVPKRTTDGNTHRMILRLEVLLAKAGITN